jgi:hypothetical protein
MNAIGVDPPPIAGCCGELTRRYEEAGRRLNGTNQLPKVIGGVKFQDGIEVIAVTANRAD